MQFQSNILYFLLLIGGMANLQISEAKAQQAPSLPLTSELSWPGTTSYNPAVPTPEQVLGHRIGERHTIPSQVVQYFEAVAKTSDRVTLREHGRTHEGRALIHAIVTRPEDQSRLDEIAMTHQRTIVNFESMQELVNESQIPGSKNPITSTREAPFVGAADITSLPAVAYMGYSVHGNEASGTEAAILTLYHLAAGEGPAIDSVLERVVTIIDPMFNPDGRDRFCDWANRNTKDLIVGEHIDSDRRIAFRTRRISNCFWITIVSRFKIIGSF